MKTGCGKQHFSRLGFLWSLPATIIGIVFALLSASIPQYKNGLFIAQSNHGLAYLFLTSRGYAAITFGRAITTDTVPWPSLIMHESHHCWQYGIFGIFFLPFYLWFNFTRGYTNNPFELQAAACAEMAIYE